jgi:hypothetical protein
MLIVETIARKGASRDNVFAHGQIRGGLSAPLQQRVRGARVDFQIPDLLQSGSRALTSAGPTRLISFSAQEMAAAG